ncbi:MAG: SDR family NAD(P)-dependent oxidoreductase [Novosphingobium sp.]|nr:SDR family NAD(P)-dependent oxidoreductase [Novosphingobium sp.]
MQTPPLPLSNRTALVTGASSGLGARFAAVLAAAGARTILTGRRTDLLERHAEVIAVSSRLRTHIAVGAKDRTGDTGRPRTSQL